jgi:hypothetical protein
VTISIVLKDLLHLRYKPKHRNFKDCAECPAFDLFDWVIWTPDDRRFQRFKKLLPATVLCLAHPKSLRTLLKLRFLIRDTILVIAGEDTNLSAVLTEVEVLAPYCKQILFEAKDIDHHNVRAFGMGFISYYLSRIDNEVIIDLLGRIKQKSWKKKGVLVAWGAIWKHLDEKLIERSRAAMYVEKSDWLVREELGPYEYFQRLASAKFLFAPAGQGIQSPKLAEAWLMRTVPIVVRNPCFEDLNRSGFPFVLLDNWEELTPNLLINYENTRRSIKWNEVEEMLTLKHFREEILGKQTK